jgi:hypothetical protein
MEIVNHLLDHQAGALTWVPWIAHWIAFNKTFGSTWTVAPSNLAPEDLAANQCARAIGECIELREQVDLAFKCPHQHDASSRFNRRSTASHVPSPCSPASPRMSKPAELFQIG